MYFCVFSSNERVLEIIMFFFFLSNGRLNMCLVLMDGLQHIISSIYR